MNGLNLNDLSHVSVGVILIVVIMIAIVLIMFFYFRKKEWFLHREQEIT